MLKHLSVNFVVNATVFQICWIACVVGSAYQLTWPSVAAFIALAVWQLQPSRRAPTDLRLMGLALILGLIVDTIWVQFDMMNFTNQWPVSSVAPLWIIMLWLAFALTVNHSLVWLKDHPALPFLMGFIGGPLAYYAGLKLGAVEFLTDTVAILVSLGFAWGVSMVILVRAAGPKLTQN